MYSLNLWHRCHYLCHHTHFIDSITPTLFMTSHWPYVWNRLHYTRHHSLTFLTSHHHLEDITPTILDIVSTLSVSSQQLYRWHHSHYMYDITSSICETFCPLYLWHHIHYVWQHNPVCWLHHTWHMYDIICTTEDVTSTLSHQDTIFMTSHPLQAWHHTPCIRHNTNCIFVITTSPLISYPLFFFFYLFYFFFFFYLWWILSYIEMKQPWVYMCSPSRYHLPPPSPPAPSRFSQCTRSECLSHASNLGWWSVSP